MASDATEAPKSPQSKQFTFPNIAYEDIFNFGSPQCQDNKSSELETLAIAMGGKTGQILKRADSSKGQRHVAVFIIVIL